MIIDGLDSLKNWLSNKLEPICDADPGALAKYVIALIKKEKSEVELKALCEDQLDVFLGDETKQFVADLFVNLSTKSYLPPREETTLSPEKIAGAEDKGVKRKSIDEEETEVEKVQKTATKIDVGRVAINNHFDIAVENSGHKFDDLRTFISTASDKNKSMKDINVLKPKNNMDKAELLGERAVSQDRSVKSVSPTKNRHGHSSRRRSSRSPNRNRHPRSSRRDRSKREHHEKSRDRRVRRREKEKCRDYEEKGFCMLGEVCPYDHGHDPLEVDDSNLPQMLTLAGLPTSQPQNFPNQQPGHLQFLPNVMPTRPLAPTIPGALTLNTGLTTVHVQKPTPIPSPIEINRNQVPIFRPRNPVAFINKVSPPVTPVTADSSNQNTAPKPTLASTSSEAYNPEAPAIEATESNKKNINKVEKFESDNRTQDELIQIAMGNVPLTPIVGTQPGNIFQMNGANIRPPTHQQFHMFPNVPVPDLVQQTYLPMSVNNQQQAFQLQVQLQQQQSAAMNQQQQPALQVPNRQPFHKNTVLEIRKIPAHLNNIVKLSEHFQKYGVITRLQTPYDNDMQGALIEFATYQQAGTAYNAPEAILGNRFIKMFWHNPNRNRNNTNQDNNQSNASASTSEEPMEVNKPKKIATSDQLKYRNPKTDPRLVKMELKKDLVKLKSELAKKKQDNYEELISKQKGILAKLEEGKNLPKEQKARLLKAFKHCDAAVQKLKEELIEEAKSTPDVTMQDPKKEILDREIDIYHGNLVGEELIEAKRALATLKRQAGYSSRGRGGYRGRGRGSWQRGGRGRGRGGHFQTNSIDNRPKQILVTGFDQEEKEAVVAHFAGFSQMDRIEETTPDKLILSFPTRQSAEVAAINGVEFNGKQLMLAWFTGQTKEEGGNSSTIPIQRRMTRSLSHSFSEKELDDLLELDKDEEEMLLAGVDDDDDEDMERSWKR